MKNTYTHNFLINILKKKCSALINFIKEIAEKLIFTFTNQQKNRVFGLDLLRAFAILIVLFAHGFDPFLAEYFPKLRLLIFIDGVDLFFVLSGFLIGSILLRQFNSNKEYSSKVIFSFWKRRWLRTLPNYYFVLIIILFMPVILPALKGNEILIPSNTWGNFFLFSQNLFKPQSEFFSEAWSLAVEEWFYLITPLILFLYYITFKNILSKKKIFLLMMVTIIIISTFYRYKIGLSLSGDIKEWDTYIRRVVFARLDSIMYGVVGAFLKFYYPIHWKNKALFTCLTILSIFLLLVIHFLYLKAIDNNTHFFMNTFYFSFSGMAVVMLLPHMDLLEKPPYNGILGILGKIISHISIISYSLYLTHGYLILGHIVRYKNEYFEKIIPNSAITGILYFTLYLLISVITSTFLYNLIEKPFMNIRNKEL